MNFVLLILLLIVCFKMYFNDYRSIIEAMEEESSEETEATEEEEEVEVTTENPDYKQHAPYYESPEYDNTYYRLFGHNDESGCQDESGMPNTPIMMGAKYAIYKQTTGSEKPTYEETITKMPESCFSKGYNNAFNSVDSKKVFS